MQWIKIFPTQEEVESRLEVNVPFTVAIGALRICLVRHERGVSAFKAFCPHAGASLSSAFVNQQLEIVCPQHAYRFSLFDGKEKSGQSCELRMYPIELREGGLYLGL